MHYVTKESEAKMLINETATVRSGHPGEVSKTARSRAMKPRVDREYIVPVLVKTCAILELLRAQRGGLRIEQIHQQTSFAKTTVYRIVRTLAVSGYVRLGEKGRYMVTEALEPRLVDVRGGTTYNAPAA